MCNCGTKSELSLEKKKIEGDLSGNWVPTKINNGENFQLIRPILNSFGSIIGYMARDKEENTIRLPLYWIKTD